MNTIKINSLPLDEVIRDIANELNITYEQNCEEYSVRIPSSLGKGKITGVNLKNGLGIIRYNCTFKEDFKIKFVKSEVHPVKFIYSLEGSVDHYFGNEVSVHEINKYENVIVASEKHNGHVLQFKGGINTDLSSVEIQRDQFQSKIRCEIKSMEKHLQELFTDVEARHVFYYDGRYSLKLYDIFKEIDSFNYENFLNILFVEGKVHEIIALQIVQYQDDLKDEGNRSLLRQYEVSQVEKAAEMIQRDITKYHNVDEISKEVGLNANKLQQGFRDLYSQTVNGYVKKTRLDMAQGLLLNTDLSLAEIVDKIGLINKSYFSKIFREKYDISPSKFRQNHRKGRMKEEK
ncbi:helix-turn-helix domain-containing protein [Autumnicola musiva]|uniref:AraC family transcriptional regulator n=1 Tax=Autumnicola musiva TaxID=3075589 RepID=A0ABU3D605_9FLAO|nr:AraC family transcriptional regulator [Zunongwangia sp. F117]MDT0676967.1 AraC family transcriptional regulator [Zunongwangia sp. F117]